jgi:hypothetical protein
MIERIRYAKQLFDAGLYELRGLVATLAGLLAGLGVFAALDPSMLPSALVPFAPQIHDMGKWALLAGVISGGVAAQSKKVLPPAPLAGAPSLLDDETGR